MISQDDTEIWLPVPLNGTNKRVWIHHLVLIAFVGPRPAGMIGCHNDGNPANNGVGNLRWDTHQANQDDRKMHGTDMPGEKHPLARLSTLDVILMRKRYARGQSRERIAADYPEVTLATVKDVLYRRSWRHI